MKSSKQKVTPPSQLDRMFQVATRAPLSLSQLLQPHALLPTGNSVPLSSEAYYTWISSALDAKGIRPSASQLGHLIRQLNGQATSSQRYETINFRVAHPAPQTYLIDLANPSCEVIHLSADGWKVTTDFDTRFNRPDLSSPFYPPVKVKTKLTQALRDIFQLDDAKSKILATWLVDAFLLIEIPPALIITGKGRHEAAGKIRNFIDPMACAVHGMPISKQAMGRLAITNRVMAVGVGKNMSQAKVDQLNELRTGMLVELKQVGRNNETITGLIRRPIIVTAEQALQIHDGQIEIEIDQLATVERSEILAAILDAAVTQIRALQEQEERQVYLQRAAPEIPISPPPELGENEGPAP